MSNFTQRLLILFGPPNSSDDEQFIREYQRLLKSYSDEIINDAIDRLARSHKYPGWPKIADCVAAAEDAIEARNWKERAKNGGDPIKNDPVAAVRLMARRFVNGSGNNWEWSPAFRDHPWVILAEKEGWGRELRASCLYSAFKRYADPYRKPNELPTVENVMPDGDTVAHWRKEAERSRSAAEWRKANPEHRAIKGAVAIDVEGLLRRNRERFEASQNEMSKRMTGERD